MTKLQTEQLIARLSEGAVPVKPLSPPLYRAALWLAGFVAVVAFAIWLHGDFAESAVRFSDLGVRFEFAGALLTGMAALIAAFFVSLPDRSRSWLMLPVIPLGFWLLGSTYGCYVHFVEFGPGGWAIGGSWACLRFILGISFPASLALYFALRRSSPLEPVGPLIVGGLGVAGLAAAALQFFHPFAITFMDLGVHILAVGIVIATMTLLGRRGLVLRT
nr:MAG: DUF1109 domain-containing protein [Hyphomicrobiales bacterium]